MSKQPMATRRDVTSLTVFRQAREERILRADLREMGAAFGQVMLDRIEQRAADRNGRRLGVITDLAEYRRTHR